MNIKRSSYFRYDILVLVLAVFTGKGQWSIQERTFHGVYILPVRFYRSQKVKHMRGTQWSDTDRSIVKLLWRM